MTAGKELAELVQAFKQASPRTMSLSQDVVREGLLAALAIVEWEHAQRFEHERERVKAILEKLAHEAYVTGAEAAVKAMLDD